MSSTMTQIKTKSRMATKSSSTIPQAVSDYAILPLILPPTSAYPTAATHYLYIRPDAPKYADSNTSRGLFISNIPVDATEHNIRALFAEQLGGSRVSHVEFDSSVPAQPTQKRWKNGPGSSSADTQDGEAKKGKKRKRDEDVVAEGVVEDEQSRLPRTWEREVQTSGSSAVVVFVDKASARGAMSAVEKAVRKGRAVRWEGTTGEDQIMGEQRYRRHHALNFPPKAEIQKSINAFLTSFTHTELARNRIRAKQRSIPDEDGFVTVVRGGRAGPARLEEAEAAKERLEERKKKKGGMEDFYRFQNREKRKEREVELRRQFEEDRRRVQEMRERRGKVRPMD